MNELKLNEVELQGLVGMFFPVALIYFWVRANRNPHVGLASLWGMFKWFLEAFANVMMWLVMITILVLFVIYFIFN